MTQTHFLIILKLHFIFIKKNGDTMYIERTAEKVIRKLSDQFKVLLVTGARQVGKSTVLRHCDNTRKYVTLDDLTERELATNEPKLFLQRHTPPVIIDEIQYAPQLLSYIKMAVDNTELKGQYWLTGSQQFHLMKNVSESLAGRVAIIDLMGLSLSEINGIPSNPPFFPSVELINNKRKAHQAYSLQDIFKIIYNGSFPALNNREELDRDIFYSSYIQTYIERDIRELSVISNEMKFLHFIRVVAARTGQVLKYSELANEVGISQPTAKSWLSLLVSSNLVYLLEPYYQNISKRMTKMPKLYFLDTGLCAYLTSWNSPEVLMNGAMNGAFFETFVVSEILKSYRHNGKRPSLYWYRDTTQKEIDLLFDENDKLYPVEIKLSANPTKLMCRHFNTIENYETGLIICMRETDIPVTDKVHAVPVGYI